MDRLSQIRHIVLELYRFSMVGVACTVLTYGTFYICLDYLGIQYVLSSNIGFILGALLGYGLNRFWTFNMTQHQFTLWEFTKYTLVTVASFSINWAGMVLMTEGFGIEPEWSQVYMLFFTAIVNYFGFKYWAFRAI